MKVKIKGTKAERELLHLFWGSEWAAIRVAGSGSMGYPSPDILAGNIRRKVAIECKSTRNKSQYLTKEEVFNLKKFAALFGAEPWIGVRFDNDKWYFLSLEDIVETKKSYVISAETAKQKGLIFDEFIN